MNEKRDWDELPKYEDVLNRATKVVSNCKKLVLVNFPIRDTDRLKTFYDVAVKNDRKLVVSLKQAYLLKLLEGKVDVPSVDDKNIRIFVPYKFKINLLK